MIADARASLERLAASDPTVAPLARLQVVALREVEEPAWLEGVPELVSTPGEDGRPLLQGVTLQVDPDRARRLFRQLAATLDQGSSGPGGSLSTRIADVLADPLDLLRASVSQSNDDLAALADRAETDAVVLAVVAHAAALPLLASCGRRAEQSVRSASWPHGYCPVCAAWPTLAEVRGLSRDLVLRCGRCGTGWPFAHRACAFCGNGEEGTQSYFAAEQERENRRATTCDQCHGYLKSQTTLGPLSLAEVLLRDLESLDLDVVALEHEYGRPDQPGWELSVQVEARSANNHGRWGRWWR